MWCGLCEAGMHGPLGMAVVSEWKFLAKKIWYKFTLSLIADILGWYVVHSYMTNYELEYGHPAMGFYMAWISLTKLFPSL